MSFSFRQTDYDVGFETRPRMLRDFLQQNLNSSEFHSFPRKPIKPSFEKSELDYYSCSTTNNLSILSKTHYPNVLYAVVAVVKNISRKLSGKSRWKFDGGENEVNSKVKVQVKDIIRWKSFCDLANEDYPPFDLTSTTTPDHYPVTIETTTTTTTTTNTTNSNNSSWCESDFTAEDLHLPSWRGYSDGEGEIGNKYDVHVSRDSKEDDKKEETLSLSSCHEEEEEEERLSPVSVLDYPFEEDEETMKRRRLLEHVKSSVSFSESCKLSDHFLDKLLLDFFCEESEEKVLRNSEKMRKVEAWMNGEGEKGILEYRKEACVEEMDREGKWKVFGEDNEREDLGLEIENDILGSLVDEFYSMWDFGHTLNNPHLDRVDYIDYVSEFLNNPHLE